MLALALMAPQAAPDSQAAERAQVEPITKTLFEAFRSGDVPALKGLFADKVLFAGDLAFLGDGRGSRGAREITRDELAKAYDSFYKAIGTEKWTGLIKQTTQSLVRANQKGGHPDDSKAELPKNFVLVGDYVYQLSFPGSGMDDIILFILRPVDGKWRIVAHWADY